MFTRVKKLKRRRFNEEQRPSGEPAGDWYHRHVHVDTPARRRRSHWPKAEIYDNRTWDEKQQFKGLGLMSVWGEGGAKRGRLNAGTCFCLIVRQPERYWEVRNGIKDLHHLSPMMPLRVQSLPIVHSLHMPFTVWLFRIFMLDMNIRSSAHRPSGRLCCPNDWQKKDRRVFKG